MMQRLHTSIGLRVAVGLTVAIMAVSGALAVQPASHVEVWPRSAAHLRPIDLGDLIFHSIPPKSGMDWDALQISQVMWVTEGIDYASSNFPHRDGLARVRANHSMARMLRQRWEELAWSVELSTEGNAKWGPTSLIMSPGVPGDSEHTCFGTGFDGCDFPQSAMDDERIRYSKICELGPGVAHSVVYLARTSDGRSGTVVYHTDGGSGGISNEVEIATLAAGDYCKAHKSDY